MLPPCPLIKQLTDGGVYEGLWARVFGHRLDEIVCETY